MSFIQPSGEVRLIKGYYGDKSYNHTVRFNNNEEQTEYFTKLSPNNQYHRLSGQKYTRYTERSIRVPYEASRYYGVTYMMFRNASAFNNKWFYAFVDRVEYVNNNLCEIFYTLDVIQSWWGDFTITSCFVEREHTLTDELFEHVIDEELEVGEYVNCWQTRINIGSYVYPEESGPPQYDYFEYDYWLAVTEVIDGTSSIIPKFKDRWSYIAGVPAPYNYIHCNGIKELEDVLSLYKIASKLDAILFVTIGKHHDSPFYEYDEDFTGYIPYAPFNYTIRNKKLYNSPFFKIVISNCLGSNTELYPELFDHDMTQNDIEYPLPVNGIPFLIGFKEVLNTRVQSSITPKYYKGVYYDDEYNRNYSVILDKYPCIPWSKDALGSWLIANQNQVSQTILNANTMANKQSTYNIGRSVAGGAIDVSDDKSLISVLKSGLNITDAIHQSNMNKQSVKNQQEMLLAKKRDLAAVPPSASAISNSDPIIYSLRDKGLGYTITVCCPEKDYLIAADNYLSMYGYKVNRVKVPNLFQDDVVLRPTFNYLKTIGCIIKPSSTGISSADIENISSIFDRGITFWEKNVYIGNYGVGNSAQPQPIKD